MKKVIQEASLYETTDLGLASSIFAKGVPLIGLRVSQDRRFTFCFELRTNVTTLVKDYWDRHLSVEPQRLFEAQKALKARIYAEGKGL